MSRLPVFLDLTGRLAVVVGGGPVAARKADDLLAAGARVTVVAPYVCEDLRDRISGGRVTWRSRDYVPGDLADAWVAVTATGSPRTDAEVVAEAEVQRVWIVNAGQAAQSPAWSAARVDLEDGATVAVSGGRDPGRAKAIAAQVRSLSDEGRLPLRRQRAGLGRVFLVGGGPGHSDLLTVRGRRLLSMADVVVMDRLAPWAALADLDDDVEVIDVGKAPGNHTMAQAEINAVLVDKAREGKVVVRLKGGDPFVLGRGGEEVQACRDAGVAVEVVPGVTSAVAVPAAAGIPVTHRSVSSSFTMISAHSAEEALAKAPRPGSTVVLLMGVGRLRAVAAGLVDADWPADTPVGIVERGWTAEQRTTVGTLADIAEIAEATGVESPAVIVIGDVVAVGRDWDLGR